MMAVSHCAKTILYCCFLNANVPNVRVSAKVPSGDGSSLSPMGKAADSLDGKLCIAEIATSSAF